MTDETDKLPQLVERVPSRVGEVSAIASGNAPFIYLDLASSSHYYDGVIGVTLEALRRVPIGDKVGIDRVLVAHLRMSVEAAKNLRAALDNTIALSEPQPDTKLN